MANTKPRGKKSAYAFFVVAFTEKMKKKGQTTSFVEMTKQCAAQWKTMSEKEKAQYVKMADKDKKRHADEMAHYEANGGAGGDDGGKKKKKKAKKDPNAPKRPLSSYLWFCNDERAKVKTEMGDVSMGEMAKELGRRWGEVPDAAKNKYVTLAAKDKARYEKELTIYNKAGGGNSQKNGSKKAAATSSKSKAVVEESEDDDEEEEEEEEDEDSDEE